MKIIRFSQKGLVGHWRFDEETGSTAKDSSPYGNDGTIYGATRVRGIIGKALSFDGVDDYVVTSALSRYTSGTILAWINPHEDIIPPPSGNYPNIAGWKADPSIYIQANTGRPYLQIIFPSAGIKDLVANTPLTANQWQMIAATWEYDGTITTMRIFRNGVEDATPLVVNDAPPTDALEFYIGRKCLYKGLIDEVRIYNRALSPGEIKIIYAFTKYIKPHPIIMRRKL